MEQLHEIILKTRMEVCERIKSYISDFMNGNKSSLTIAGHRGMGKTSLLKWTQYEYKVRSDELITVYIDIGEIANPAHFVDIICKETKNENILPIQWEERIRLLFEILEDNNVKIVLLIDNAHNNTLFKSNLMEVLRNAYQKYSNLYLMFTSDIEYLDMLYTYAKAFFGQSTILYLEPLNAYSCEKLITQYVQDIDIEHIRNIVTISEGNPSVLKMLIFIASSVTSKSLFNQNDRTGLINQMLKEYLKSVYDPQLSPQVRAILKEFSCNESITVSNASEHLFMDVGSLINQLNRLIKKGLVEKGQRGSYKVKEYIRYLYR